MKQSNTSPTLTHGTPNPQQAQKVSARRALIKRCAALVASVAWLEAGCAGGQKRPEPEDCPEATRETMWQELRWDDGTQPFILLDVTKGTVEEAQMTQRLAQPRPRSRQHTESAVARLNRMGQSGVVPAPFLTADYPP